MFQLDLRKNVFPARAGMSPPDPPRPGWVFCVPRASGDEPGYEATLENIAACSPRERG